MAQLTCEDCENECEYCGDKFDPKESGNEFRCKECITNDRQVCDICDEQCDGEDEYKKYVKGLYCLDCSPKERKYEECITNDLQICDVCHEKCDEKPCDDKFGYEKICDGEIKYKIYVRGLYCLKCSPKCICCEKYYDPETSEADDICGECCEKGLGKCDYCQEVISKGYTNKHASFACIDCVIQEWQKI